MSLRAINNIEYEKIMYMNGITVELFLNVFTEFTEFRDKNYLSL